MMDVVIGLQGEGWVIVEAEEFVVNIHPDCEGMVGELRNAALRVHELIALLDRNTKDFA